MHKLLESHLDDYSVCDYHPVRTYFPPLLWQCCREGNPSLIHTTPDHGLFFLRHNAPMVLTFHNYVLDWSMQNYGSLLQRLHWRTDLRWLTRKALDRADKVTAVSDFTASLVHSDLGFKGDIQVIPNGVDTSIFFPGLDRSDDGVVRVLFSGNPTARKGAQWLKGIAGLLQSGIEIWCTGGLRGATEDTAGQRIRYLGPISYMDMPAVYREADMLLLPTVREGHSLAVLEAMASGLPVVASRCSSLPEQVIEGEGGCLVDVGDVQQYAAAIHNLAEDQEARDAMGAFNRRRTEQVFPLQRMISTYRELFSSAYEK
ncbi:MAG: glycosyltransferase family 4 protein [Candidatus Sedimenticola sp. (ex Thyasira tokunagai)]